MRAFPGVVLLGAIVLAARFAAADEVFFVNGDRLTGKIISATDGKLVLKTDAAGEITIDLAKVKTFSTDAPVQIQLGERMPPVASSVAPARATLRRCVSPTRWTG